jgi:GldM N-terminal domain
MNKILFFCCLIAFANCTTAQKPTAQDAATIFFTDGRLNDILAGNLKEDEAAAADLFKAISEQKPQHLATAQKLQTQANKYLASIESARQLLFTRAGGPHPKHPDRPLNYKSNEITTQLFITEGLGEKLYTEGILYKNDLIETCKNDKKCVKWLNENLLTINEEAGSPKQSWAEQRFKQMPVAAVLPSIAKMKNDTELALVLLLKYLLEH